MSQIDTLIGRLSADTAPVRPLPRPERRALAWFVFALAVVVAVMAWHGINPNGLKAALTDWRMIAEIAATFVTAIGATLAAFQTTVPGHRRTWLWLPFASLGVWLVLTGAGCAADYTRIGSGAFALRLDTACFVPGAIAGAVLGIVLVLMLRRGAPLVPRLTLMFAGLAVAATVNLGLLVLHEGDVSVMLLVWHTLYVAGLGVIGGAVGNLLFGWRHKHAG